MYDIAPPKSTIPLVDFRAPHAPPQGESLEILAAPTRGDGAVLRSTTGDIRNGVCRFLRAPRGNWPLPWNGRHRISAPRRGHPDRR